MPFNAGGSTTRTTKTSGGTTWASDAAASNPINATEFDTEAADIYAMLAKCITNDGNQTVTADIPWNNNKITGLKTPTASTDAATKAYVDASFFGYSAYKTATTSITSNTTLAADPHLSISVTTTGVYVIECLIVVSGTSSGAQGIKNQLNYSGSISGTVNVLAVNGYINGANYANGNVGVNGTLINATITTAAASDFIKFTGCASLTGTGTFQLQSAQNSSSGNATNIWAGSYMTLRKIA